MFYQPIFRNPTVFAFSYPLWLAALESLALYSMDYVHCWSYYEKIHVRDDFVVMTTNPDFVKSASLNARDEMEEDEFFERNLLLTDALIYYLSGAITVTVESIRLAGYLFLRGKPFQIALTAVMNIVFMICLRNNVYSEIYYKFACVEKSP